MRGRHPDSKAVTCLLCGQKYFEASLAFHLKACAQKAPGSSFRPAPCPLCGVMVNPASNLPTHVRSGCTLLGGTGGDSKAPQASPARARVSAAVETPIRTRTTASRATDAMDAQPFDPSGLTPCHVCGRKFVADRVGVHEDICQRTKKREGQLKKREFDSVKKRLQGIAELNPGFKASPQRPLKTRAPSTSTRTHTQTRSMCSWHTNWRGKHHEFMSVLREMRRHPARRDQPSAAPAYTTANHQARPRKYPAAMCSPSRYGGGGLSSEFGGGGGGGYVGGSMSGGAGGTTRRRSLPSTTTTMNRNTATKSKPSSATPSALHSPPRSTTMDPRSGTLTHTLITTSPRTHALPHNPPRSTVDHLFTPPRGRGRDTVLSSSLKMYRSDAPSAPPSTSSLPPSAKASTDRGAHNSTANTTRAAALSSRNMQARRSQASAR